MEHLGNSHDREIFYTNIWKDPMWIDQLPSNNWLIFIIGQGDDIDSYIKLAEKSIENNVLYVCAAGQNSERIHDLFDETVIANKIKNGQSIDSPDDFIYSPLTTYDNNLSDGFWFAITSAHHEMEEIETIVCVDFTKQRVKRHLMTLIEKINDRWFPSDEENEEPVYDNPH